MRKVLVVLAAITAGISLAPPASAGLLFLRGKVLMEDGTPPGKMVAIEQNCTGMSIKIVATTNSKTGEYLWRAEAGYLGLDIFTGGGSSGASLGVSGPDGGGAITPGLGVGNCVLQASLSGYHSTTIDLMDKSLFREPRLPLLTLAANRPGTNMQIDQTGFVPGSVRKAWDAAVKAMIARNWVEAENQLRGVTATAPKFRPGWESLGMAYLNQQKSKEARDAYERAVALDSKELSAQLGLVRAELGAQDWEAASRAATALIGADSKHRFLEAYLHDAIAQYHLRKMDLAESRVNELLRLDKAHQVPRAEYVLGMILEGKKEIDAAREHMQKYLALQPGATDASAARARIGNLGKGQAGGPDSEIDAPNLTADNPGEASVPGGLKAFATIAHMENEPTYDNFFLDYCRRLLEDASPYVEDHIPVYGGQLRAYMAAVDDLVAAGEPHGPDAVVVTLSMKDAAERARTARLLRQFGWTLDETGAAPEIELGDQPADGLRHRIPASLGIDEIAMRDALEAGRNFQFEIHTENARLVGGIRWAAALKTVPPSPGGMAEVFSQDLRFTKAYAGLGAMSVDTALGLISNVGVPALVTQYADVLALCSSAFTVSGGRVSTPGGTEALPVWAKLAGADPAKPPTLFQALLTKDGGRLAVFYSTLSQADEKRQRYFTSDAARAQRYYEWFRDANEMRFITDRLPQNWRRDLLGAIPLDDSGKVRFPGGREAWSSSSGTDDDVILKSESMDALVPVAAMEEKRGAPLDAASVKLLARHYAEWKSLFPYFDRLPGLGSAEFQALAAFTEAASSQSVEARNTSAGEWQSLVKLIVLGAQAGSLDKAAAAQAFARACTALTGPEPSPKALAALREMAGGQGSVDEAVATRLLRLSGKRRADFDRIRAFQAAPTIDAALAAPTPATTLAALTGLVYAAVLDPGGLLVSEDPGVMRRHRFVPVTDSKNRSVFFPTSMARTEKNSASYMTGGFATFEEATRGLARHKLPLEAPAAPVAAAKVAAKPAAASAPTEAVFRVSGRLVEVHATVTDGRGRYIDDVPGAEFTLLDDGKPVPASSFEKQSTAVSVALLFDSTGSMQSALPPLKSGAIKLISEMRPTDAVAVYSFNAAVTEQQAFTTDKHAAERAVLLAHAMGGTALYDALVRVNRDLSARTGKKAIVVFTDGDDNLSTLTAEIAVARAKAAGAPIYTVAQGEALRRPEFLDLLAGISTATGGLPFAIHAPEEILKVFEHLSQDLTHGYMLTFQPPPDEGNGWHTIKVALRSKGHIVRAREGYSLE